MSVLTGSFIKPWMSVRISILSSPLLDANTYKQTTTHAKSVSSITAKSSNWWKGAKRDISLISPFIFFLQRLVYFCFLSYGSFWRGCSTRKDKHMGCLIIYSSTSSTNNTAFIHQCSCLQVCFSLPIFSPLWSKKENRVGNGEAFMCSVWGPGVSSKKWQVGGCRCCQRVRLKAPSSRSVSPLPL